MIRVLVLFAFLAVAFATLRDEFELFKRTYNKLYSTPEENEQRFEIYQQNLVRASALNRPDALASFGVTKFMDLAPQEFKKFYLLPDIDVSTWPKAPVWEDEHPEIKASRTALPTKFDWNSKGMVTAVKNQGQCGSCWAFSATETIESVDAINAKATPMSLSVQQIVDCDTSGNDQGCDGGYPYGAYEYIMQAGGQEGEADYPYAGTQGNCKFESGEIVDKISNWKYVTQNADEKVIQNFVYSNSPVSVCVDAETWQFYKGGVITDESNCGTTVDHCVQITGWKSENSTDCWNVRNSWGTDWGESGYVWVERGKDVCGIAQAVTVPVASSKK